jgi:predicted transposase/invertase (TIGR01784 family)
MAEIDNPHDKFFKEVFGQPDIAADFMANYLPAEVVAELDLSAPELVKDSFVDASLQEHFSDLLYKVKLRGTDTEAFIFFLFEHKSFPDQWVALQILRYLLELWEKERDAGAKKLSPVFPVVFYHGRSHWSFPVNFNALIDFKGRDHLKPFAPEYHYFLCDLTQLAEAQVKGGALLQTTMLLMKNVRRRDLRQRLQQLWARLTDVAPERLMNFVTSCFAYISSANDYLNAEQMKRILKESFPDKEGSIMAKLAHDWIEQGIQQGRQQELASTCVRLLHRRIGIFPAIQEAQIRKLSLEQLMQLSEDLLDFSASAELSNWLAVHTSQGK